MDLYGSSKSRVRNVNDRRDGLCEKGNQSGSTDGK